MLKIFKEIEEKQKKTSLYWTLTSKKILLELENIEKDNKKLLKQLKLQHRIIEKMIRT